MLKELTADRIFEAQVAVNRETHDRVWDRMGVTYEEALEAGAAGLVVLGEGPEVAKMLFAGGMLVGYKRAELDREEALQRGPE